MCDRSKYVDLFMPEHHRSRSSGNVHEHIVRLEEYLRRPLTKDEVVHHEDGNRSNNTKGNLYVFKDQANHARYHATGLKHFNGVNWESEPVKGSKSNPHIRNCKNCKEDFFTTLDNGKYCSLDCSHKASRKCERPNKEELEDLLKNKSFVEVGRIFGVSDNSVRKWCLGFGLPNKSSYYRGL